ncbi:MAG: hypothetical protein EOM67_03555 [Spirochaetia bacterium]|nr:hypothetical protein [Spirochaetia bacterium]
MKAKKIQLTRDITITIVAIVLSILSISMISHLTIDSSTDAFIPNQSEVVQVNKTIEAEFGSLDALVLGVQNKTGSILNPHSLSLIQTMTQEIESFAGVHSVMSLTNLDHIDGDEFGMKVVPLFSGVSETEIELMKERLGSWKEIYDSSLISKDQTMASIVVTMEKELPASDQKELMDSINALSTKSNNNGETFTLIGLPVVKQQINESLVSDMIILAPIVGLLIIMVLFFSFRKIVGVILPLITIFFSASIVVALMIIFNITFTMATMLVPVLLLIVASAYAIHVMSHFYEEILEKDGDVSYEEIGLTISSVIKKNKMPIILAGITTAAGFVAQLTSPLSPFRMFGLLSAFGVVISQIASLILLPALLRITYRNGLKKEVIASWKKREAKGSKHIFSNFIALVVIKYKKIFVVVSLVLLTLTIVLIPRIESGTDMLKFFKPNSKIVQDTSLYNDKMGGSGLINVMITHKEGKRILNPTFLAKLDTFESKLEEFNQVGKIQSIAPYIKRMNYMLNKQSVPYQQQEEEEVVLDFFSDSFSFDETAVDNEDELIIEGATLDFDSETYREIPTDPLKYGLSNEADLTNLISQYLVLYSGNLDMLINDTLEPDKTNITIMIKDTGVESTTELTDFINEYWNDETDNYDVAIGGGEAIALALTKLVTKSQIYSLVSSLLIVFILLAILFRSIKYGFIGLIPVAFALMGIFSSMALLSIPLDIITSLLAALAIGIGVDYAIHYISAYRRIERTNGDAAFLVAIMNTTGRAIIINMVSVTLGFAGLIFSRFIPVQQMGILFCISMIAAGLSSITVLPIALQFLHKKTNKEGNK